MRQPLLILCWGGFQEPRDLLLYFDRCSVFGMFDPVKGLDPPYQVDEAVLGKCFWPRRVPR